MADMMGEMDIAFPNLGIYLHDVPKTIMIGNFGIALYGIVIAVGMLLGLTLAAKVAGLSGEDPDTVWDLAAVLIVFSILGARIYYVIFMWDYYKENPAQILNIRGGGLAIYGGIIAGVLTVYFYCKRKKKNFARITDILVNGLLVGQILGRWGNFFNREVFGEYTDNLFAMGYIGVHRGAYERRDELYSGPPHLPLRGNVEPGTADLSAPLSQAQEVRRRDRASVFCRIRDRKGTDRVDPDGSAVYRRDENSGLHGPGDRDGGCFTDSDRSNKDPA